MPYRNKSQGLITMLELNRRTLEFVLVTQKGIKTLVLRSRLMGCLAEYIKDLTFEEFESYLSAYWPRFNNLVRIDNLSHNTVTLTFNVVTT